MAVNLTQTAVTHLVLQENSKESQFLWRFKTQRSTLMPKKLGKSLHLFLENLLQTWRISSPTRLTSSQARLITATRSSRKQPASRVSMSWESLNLFKSSSDWSRLWELKTSRKLCCLSWTETTLNLEPLWSLRLLHTPKSNARFAKSTVFGSAQWRMMV